MTKRDWMYLTHAWLMAQLFCFAFERPLFGITAMLTALICAVAMATAKE